ncbi:MAG: hypothetical protein ABID35_00225 [Candidatus Margulisiibacteriota bacterium]
MTRVYPGPFTAPKRTLTNQPKRSVILSPGSSLPDRLSFLSRSKQALTTCQNLRELQARTLEQGFKNFHFTGKSVVFVGVLGADKFTALTIPETLPPFPQNASRYIGAGFPKTFPLQHDLVQQAIQTKQIIKGASADNEYLAVPLVSESRDEVFGAMLISNRYSEGRIKFTNDDIVVARSFAEMISSAIPPLLVG